MLTEAGEVLAEKLPPLKKQLKTGKNVQEAAWSKSIKRPIWQKFEKSCTNRLITRYGGNLNILPWCGGCTYLCPTASALILSMKLTEASGCGTGTPACPIYSQEASGHNPRPSKAERTRQRIMHKFAYWFDNEAASGCTGAGAAWLCVRLILIYVKWSNDHFVENSVRISYEHIYQPIRCGLKELFKKPKTVPCGHLN